MKKILLRGFFGYNNLGDDLLLKEALCKYPQEVKLFVGWPRNAIKELQYFQKYHPFTPIYGIKDLLKHFYDAVIWSGGGLFPSRVFSWKNCVKMLPYKILSRKMILNGLGIVEKPNRKWFDCFLRMVDYCSVRDDKSLNFVSPQIKAINCGDLYWGANQYVRGGNLISSKRLLVCLANPFSDQELQSKSVSERFEKLIKQCVDFIEKYKQKGYEVNYLPFYHGSDEKFIDRVQVKLHSNDKVLQRDIDYDLDTIDELFRQYEFGLCMRFHSILLSIKNSLPIVAIEYDFKSEMLMKEVGLEKFGVRYGIRKSDFFGEEFDIDGDSLCSIADVLQKEKEIFKSRANSFAQLKHQQVLDNYQNIFSLVL